MKMKCGWNVLSNPADGNCGIYSVQQHMLMKKLGMSAAKAVETIRDRAGTPEMKQLIKTIRRSVVDYVLGSPEHKSSWTNQGSSKHFNIKKLKKPRKISNKKELQSEEEWTEAMLEDGHVDNRFILALGHIFGFPVRIVYEVTKVGLVDYHEPYNAVKTTDKVATVLWTKGLKGINHFEALSPDAHDASTKAFTGNHLAWVMWFFRQAVNPMPTFIRRIPRHTGTGKKAHKTRRTRKWTRESTPLTISLASRFRSHYIRLRSIGGGKHGDGDNPGSSSTEGATKELTTCPG